MGKLLVVLDPHYGERLLEVWTGQPIWIVMSPTNEPFIRSFWQNKKEPNELTGITGFKFDPNVSTAERFLEEFDMIDLHEGSFSSGTPYSELEVIGVPMTEQIREFLSNAGFVQFDEKPESFTARRV